VVAHGKQLQFQAAAAVLVNLRVKQTPAVEAELTLV
jgi:hypothetical protein